MNASDTIGLQAGSRRLVYVIAATILVILLLGTLGLNMRQRQDAAAQDQQKSGMHTGGLMDAEYVRVRSLSAGILKTGAVTDSDLGWLLTLLKDKPDAIVHAKVLAILSELKTVPAQQQALISAALPPLLQSENVLESQPAQRVKDMLARTGSGKG